MDLRSGEKNSPLELDQYSQRSIVKPTKCIISYCVIFIALIKKFAILKRQLCMSHKAIDCQTSGILKKRYYSRKNMVINDLQGIIQVSTEDIYRLFR